MTDTVKNLRAKLARRDKRIAALTAENIEARQIIYEAIRKARMTAQENAVLKNNIKAKPKPARIAKRMEDLQRAEAILRRIKGAMEYGRGFIRNYEEQSRKTL